MHFRTSIFAAVAAATSALGAEAPSHQRMPLQTDFDRCVLRIADTGNEDIQGRLRFQLLIRPSGNVFAAFVHSEKGVEERRLERCLTSMMVLWKLPPVALDYSRAYELTFIPGGTHMDFSDSVYHSGGHYAGAGRASVFMPDINDPPHEAPFDVAVAQQTLEIADFASEAEHGIANLEVRKYPEAILSFRQALEATPDDPQALRGLAIALAESGQDLRQARFVGERGVALYPQSEATHEALLRVCLAANDDGCAFREFGAARDAGDVGPRSRQLASLQPLVEKAAARLRAFARAGDACAGEKSERDRAMCVVRRCLDAGTSAFAEEISGEKGVVYEAQDWKSDRMNDGKMVVTRPISDGRDQREPRWLVKIGETTVHMTPTNADARHVTMNHNACGVVQSSAFSAREIVKSPAIEEKIEKLSQKK